MAAGRLVAIVRVEADGSVVVRDLASGALRTTSASELSAPPYPSEPAGLPHAIACATDAQWERARRREAVIAGIAHVDDAGDQVALAAARLGVSRRTLFRWLALYRRRPADLVAAAAAARHTRRRSPPGPAGGDARRRGAR